MSDSAPASTSHMETAGQTETSDDNLVPPGAQAYPQGLGTADDSAEVSRLAMFLAVNFPDEVNRTNVQVPESPVDVAIRLLTGLHAHTANAEPDVRCAQEFCNKPQGHTDVHGWVHYG